MYQYILTLGKILVSQPVRTKQKAKKKKKEMYLHLLQYVQVNVTARVCIERNKYTKNCKNSNRTR